MKPIVSHSNKVAMSSNEYKTGHYIIFMFLMMYTHLSTVTV